MGRRWMLTVLALPLATALGGEIYRVVDEDGNVTYTDQKPSEDAEPLDLPELNVLEGAGEVPVPETEAGQSSAPSLDFGIERPAEGETVRRDDARVPVTLDINVELPATAEIVLYLDDRPVATARSLETAIEQVEPGRHRLEAELRTPGGRVLAAAGPVRFEMRAAASP